jgi:hypothetical protein
MAKEDLGHLAPFVNLRIACRAISMADRELANRKPMAVCAGYKFPPESFFHAAEFL